MVVDDGTDQAEDSFVVVVKEERQSPEPGMAFALAALVLPAVVAMS